MTKSNGEELLNRLCAQMILNQMDLRLEDRSDLQRRLDRMDPQELDEWLNRLSLRLEKDATPLSVEQLQQITITEEKKHD